mmetsp:Transcript_1376/g.2764  ORF Transcript_1376/g.2764 Transcript_1376/m.2764 type:complete len:317 (+) Transcript_1376:1639-2589(+)
MKRIFQVDARQDCENVGLDGRHEDFEAVDRHDANDRRDTGEAERPGKTGKHFQNRVACHDVACQTNGVADRAYEVGNQLDDRQDRTQYQRRGRNPEEAQEADAVLHEAQDRHCQEHCQRQYGGHGDVRGGGETRRDQAQEVGKENVEKQREDVGEVGQRVLACHVLHHAADEAVGEFRHRLAARRDHVAAPGAPDHQCDDAKDGQRHPERRVGDGEHADFTVAEERRHDELVHRVDCQTAGVIVQIGGDEPQNGEADQDEGHRAAHTVGGRAVGLGVGALSRHRASPFPLPRHRGLLSLRAPARLSGSRSPSGSWS